MTCGASGWPGMTIGYARPGGLFIDEFFQVPQNCVFITEQMYKSEEAVENLAELVGPQAAEAMAEEANNTDWIESLDPDGDGV